MGSFARHTTTSRATGCNFKLWRTLNEATNTYTHAPGRSVLKKCPHEGHDFHFRLWTVIALLSKNMLIRRVRGNAFGAKKCFFFTFYPMKIFQLYFFVFLNLPGLKMMKVVLFWVSRIQLGKSGLGYCLVSFPAPSFSKSRATDSCNLDLDSGKSCAT